jgi:hypothetical protein
MTKRLYIGQLNRNYRDAIAKELGGWHCVSCGIKDKEVLAFDHRNGDGEEDRKRLGGQYSTIRYYFHNPVEAREKLQVLCCNCNWKKNASENQAMGQSRTAVWERWARKKLVEILGGSRCAKCGLTDATVLTIDHASGGRNKGEEAFRGIFADDQLLHVPQRQSS